MKVDMKDKHFFCSWSGGKDSSLALYRAIKAGGQPQLLFTMFNEEKGNSHCHGLSKEIIYAQAKALKLPIEIAAATWDTYEATYLSSMENFKNMCIDYGIFGDIDIEQHRDWVTKICETHDITAHLPLWQESRKALLEEFIDLGFEAIIVTVRDEFLDKSFLGKTLTKDLIAELEAQDIDACGENGEFHTLVINGPIFSEKLNVRFTDTHSHSNCTFLKIELDK